MKTFTETAFYAPTFTTVDDPELKVTERSNGHRWYLDFEVGDNSIDWLDLEYPTPLRLIHKDVLTLPVYDEDGKPNGTVYSILASAIELDKALQKAYSKNIN
jgi:hypothetical protein